MSLNSQYNYDFSYSITPPDTNIPFQSTQQLNEFSNAAALLVDSQIIKGRNVMQFWTVISRQNAMGRLVAQVQELIEIQLELNGRRTMRDNDRQYLLREELCGPLKELQAMMGRERQYYTNLTILLLTLVLLRLLHGKYGVKLQKRVVFHLLHWQLKGQHSTDLSYNALAADTLRAEIADQYIQGEQITHQSASLKYLQGSMAFKRPPSMVSSFAVAFNKENHALNQNFKPSFKTFKKGNASNTVIDLNTTRPSTFANCGYAK